MPLPTRLRVEVRGFRVQDLGFRVHNSGFRVEGGLMPLMTIHEREFPVDKSTNLTNLII